MMPNAGRTGARLSRLESNASRSGRTGIARAREREGAIEVGVMGADSERREDRRRSVQGTRLGGPACQLSCCQYGKSSTSTNIYFEMVSNSRATRQVHGNDSTIKGK